MGGISLEVVGGYPLLRRLFLAYHGVIRHKPEAFMTQKQTPEASPFDLPAVISSQVATGVQSSLANNDAWMVLHRAHVKRLQSAWGSVLSRLGVDGLVIHSGLSVLKYSRDDQYWPTAMTPHFAHWCPYAETPAFLVIRPGEKPKLITERHQSFWEGPAPRNLRWDQTSFDVETVDDLGDHRLPIERKAEA